MQSSLKFVQLAASDSSVIVVVKPLCTQLLTIVRILTRRSVTHLVNSIVHAFFDRYLPILRGLT
jgi:hypothetical protein